MGVVALNWRDRAILPGACKWSADPARQSRGAGFTEAEAMGAMLVDLETLED